MTHLIHYHNLNFIHFRYTLLDQVQYPAWCSYDNMHYKNTQKAKGQGHCYWKAFVPVLIFTTWMYTDLGLNVRKLNNIYIRNNRNLFLFKLALKENQLKVQ